MPKDRNTIKMTMRVDAETHAQIRVATRRVGMRSANAFTAAAVRVVLGMLDRPRALPGDTIEAEIARSFAAYGDAEPTPNNTLPNRQRRRRKNENED